MEAEPPSQPSLPRDVVRLLAGAFPRPLMGKLALVSAEFRAACLEVAGPSPEVRFDLLGTREEIVWAIGSVCWDGPGAAAVSQGLGAAGDTGLLDTAWQASSGRLLLDHVSAGAAARGHVPALRWADRTTGWDVRGDGQLPLARWLAVDGVVRAALANGRADVLEYAEAAYGLSAMHPSLRPDVADLIGAVVPDDDAESFGSFMQLD